MNTKPKINEVIVAHEQKTNAAIPRSSELVAALEVALRAQPATLPAPLNATGEADLGARLVSACDELGCEPHLIYTDRPNWGDRMMTILLRHINAHKLP